MNNVQEIPACARAQMADLELQLQRVLRVLEIATKLQDLDTICEITTARLRVEDEITQLKRQYER